MYEIEQITELIEVIETKYGVTLTEETRGNLNWSYQWSYGDNYVEKHIEILDAFIDSLGELNEEQINTCVHSIYSALVDAFDLSDVLNYAKNGELLMRNAPFGNHDTVVEEEVKPEIIVRNYPCCSEEENKEVSKELDKLKDLKDSGLITLKEVEYSFFKFLFEETEFTSHQRFEVYTNTDLKEL